jgi:hypothetical protein
MAPLGNGFGTEQVGGQYYATGQADFNHYECLLPRLAMETGVMGLVGYLLVCTGALLALQRAAQLTIDVGVRAMLVATQMFLVIMFYENVVFDHTASAFVWMIFAAVMAAVETNKKAGILPGQMAKTRFYGQGKEIAEIGARRIEDRSQR